MSLLLMTIGGSGMYSVAVVLPRLQAEFGVARGDASLPYTLTMIGFGFGGILMGRLSDRFGVMVAVIDRHAGPGRGLHRGGLGREPVAVHAGARRADRLPRRVGHVRAAGGGHVAVVHAPPRHRASPSA